MGTKMTQVGFMNRSLFTLGMLHGLLMLQTTYWQQNVRPAFQFIILSLFSSQVYLISKIFDGLSKEALEIILGNLFEPIAFFFFSFICLFGCLALVYSVMVGKVMKSLIG